MAVKPGLLKYIRGIIRLIQLSIILDLHFQKCDAMNLKLEKKVCDDEEEEEEKKANRTYLEEVKQ